MLASRWFWVAILIAALILFLLFSNVLPEKARWMIGGGVIAFALEVALSWAATLYSYWKEERAQDLRNI